MKNFILTNVLPTECYVLEIDGKIKSDHKIFMEALKAGMELKQKFPHSDVKVHDANEQTRTAVELPEQLETTK